MRWNLMAIVAVVAILCTTNSATAHHSTAMYDNVNRVTVTGVVKTFDWTNPHAFIFLEVKGENGSVKVWEVEMMSLNHLRSYGWTSKTVKPGDVISATGSPARSGAPSMIANLMKLADGREIRS